MSQSSSASENPAPEAGDMGANPISGNIVLRLMQLGLIARYYRSDEFDGWRKFLGCLEGFPEEIQEVAQAYYESEQIEKDIKYWA